MKKATMIVGTSLLLLALWLVPNYAAEPPAGDSPLALIVMDPLAAPLACDCVQGYAQRKYEELGKYLEEQLGCKVAVYWSESLETALQESDGRADLIIGKHSVVLSDAKKLKKKITPVAQLTDQEGVTTQTGLFVVRAQDPALTIADLDGYRIFFGPSECDEKHAAPMRLLKNVGAAIPTPVETCKACSIAATRLVAMDPDIKAAAMISSYAKPLLEGCGTVERGALRVVGMSEPVPFITAFTSDALSKDHVRQIQSALFSMASQPPLLVALETKAGFQKVDASLVKKK
jgi:ABC-type phosphate/phosphonate transport system substrate-binding protein